MKTLPFITVKFLCQESIIHKLQLNIKILSKNIDLELRRRKVKKVRREKRRKRRRDDHLDFAVYLVFINLSNFKLIFNIL